MGWIEVAEEDLSTASSSKEYQLIALTFTGGWYRLSLPKLAGSSKRNSGTFKPSNLGSLSPAKAPLGSRPGSVAGSTTSRVDKGSTASRLDKGKEKEQDKGKPKKVSRNCTLQEYRRFGRWDGWG